MDQLNDVADDARDIDRRKIKLFFFDQCPHAAYHLACPAVVTDDVFEYLADFI